MMTDIEDISGGEQATIAFSYRVVLNMVVSDLVGINLPLIFDEPTYGFSQTKLSNLRNSIKELRFNQLKNKQVIIVSHEERFRDIADYSLLLETGIMINRKPCISATLYCSRRKRKIK